MKHNRSLLLAILLMTTIAVSCEKEEHITYIPSVNGLWASSSNNLEADVQTLILAEFSDGRATLHTFDIGKGLSSISADKEYAASVTYNSSKDRGNIKVDGNSSMSFEFGLSKSSDMMFLRNDSRRFSLARYDVSLDEMVRSLQSSLTPSIQLMDGFVGPSEYVNLTAERPSLSVALSADPVKENMGYEVKENLRAGDLAVIAQSLFLTRLCYHYGNFTDATRESLCEELKGCFESYEAFSKAHPVEHHDGQAICQMAGKKIMMQLQTDGSDPHQEYYNYYINANKAIEASKDFSIGEKSIGIAWLERHGFLWMEQWFKQWDTYYDNQLWFRTQITDRF